MVVAAVAEAEEGRNVNKSESQKQTKGFAILLSLSAKLGEHYCTVGNGG